MLTLNDFLRPNGVDPEKTIVFRHTPVEPRFKKVLPWLAESSPELYNAYQCYQGAIVEKALTARMGGWVASFIGYGPRKAIFAGLYRIAGSQPETLADFWAHQDNKALRELGCTGFTEAEGREHILRFDLQPLVLQDDWRGKLVIGWPPPDVSWFGGRIRR